MRLGVWLWAFSTVVLQRLVLDRIDLMEKMLFDRFGSRRLRMVFWAGLLGSGVYLVQVVTLVLTWWLDLELEALENWEFIRAEFYLISFCSVLSLVFSISVGASLFRVFMKLKHSQEIVRRHSAQVEAKRSSDMAKWQVVYVVATLLTSALVALGEVWWAAFRIGYVLGDFVIFDVSLAMTSFLDVATNTACVCLLSGQTFSFDCCNSQEALRSRAVDQTERERRRRQRSLRKCWRKQQKETDTHGWRTKVEEMAHRGFSLRKLLDFYRGLGRDYMLHWNPDIHTTNDVVRQAIIPLSADKQCALSELMSEGKATRPHRMVTHSWRNQFNFLVSAIVADALDRSEYGLIADLLKWDPDSLVKLLEAHGTLDRTYWVCAFSVNQHDGICAANPGGECDSVTGEEFPVCSCGKSKHFNSDPPLTSSGKSVQCELNKFDDMMSFLAATDKNFSQVIAVSPEYLLFSRAWCVAEIAAANQMGMEQKLKLLSRENFRAKRKHLRNLKVQEMQASRKEDIDEILSKIPDCDDFNQRLSELIFSDETGLLAAWGHMDANEQLSRIGVWLVWASKRGQSTSCWDSSKLLSREVSKLGHPKPPPQEIGTSQQDRSEQQVEEADPPKRLMVSL
eukprot:TRINITY_DN9294_c0_g1_i1.p1 TRINITY_DN9294_c0_g1~~TRINITY_DN9294_c0_g1_i1.p1  ORF type:complete len:623 (-),score=110.88 TRINITY_DN9294_c0_g1_i1:46-1914(-)